MKRENANPHSRGRHQEHPDNEACDNGGCDLDAAGYCKRGCNPLCVECAGNYVVALGDVCPGCQSIVEIARVEAKS